MMRSLSIAMMATALLLTGVARAETKVAVLPLDSHGDDEKTAGLLTDLITAEVAKRKDLKVISANEVKNMMSFEQQKSLVGCNEEGCLAEIGAALGVDALVTGSIGKLENAGILNLSLLDIKHGTVLSRVSETSESGVKGLLPLLPYMVGTLLSAIPGGPPPPEKPGAAKQGGSSSSSSSSSSKAAAGKKEEEASSGGSSLPRRIGGGVVAVVGVALLLVAGAIGAASVGYLLVTKVGSGSTEVLANPFVRTVGFGAAGVADVLGVISVLVVLAGIVVAALP